MCALIQVASVISADPQVAIDRHVCLLQSGYCARISRSMSNKRFERSWGVSNIWEPCEPAFYRTRTSQSPTTRPFSMWISTRNLIVVNQNVGVGYACAVRPHTADVCNRDVKASNAINAFKMHSLPKFWPRPRPRDPLASASSFWSRPRTSIFNFKEPAGVLSFRN